MLPLVPLNKVTPLCLVPWGTESTHLDLDALMFSPLHPCFLNNKFYSHYEDACVEWCAGAALGSGHGLPLGA